MLRFAEVVQHSDADHNEEPLLVADGSDGADAVSAKGGTNATLLTGLSFPLSYEDRSVGRRGAPHVEE